LKVARDKAVKNWKFIEGIEEVEGYGSGYPSGKSAHFDAAHFSVLTCLFMH